VNKEYNLALLIPVQMHDYTIVYYLMNLPLTALIHY